MIQDLKELQKLFKLCRAQGVMELDFGGVKVKFGDLPAPETEIKTGESILDPEDPWSAFPAGELSPEQLAFYSSGGKPEDDPYRTDQ